MQKLYVLSVGINTYQYIQSPLTACQQDVRKLRSFLTTAFGPESGVELIYESLDSTPMKRATRQAIIDKFENFLSQASKGDAVLFHFSGHGTRQASAVEFGELDGMNESLCCYDSRAIKGGDQVFHLADKEMRVLLSKISQKGAHITVILDCCHSGSATRSEVIEGMLMREHIEDPELAVAERMLSSYYGYSADMVQDGKVEAPDANYLVISACAHDEKAREELNRGGIFTQALLHVLKSQDNLPSLADLYTQVYNRIQQRAKGKQSPVFEFYGEVDPFSQFLTGKKVVGSSYPPLVFDGDADEEENAWFVSLGAISGLDPNKESAHKIPLFEGDDRENVLGYGKLVSIGLSQSRIELPKDIKLDPRKKYVAGIMPFALLLRYRGPKQEILKAAIRDQLSADKVNWISETEDAEYILEALEEEYRILRKRQQEEEIFITGIASNHSYALSFILLNLKKIARWECMRNLSSPKDSRINASDILFRFDELEPEGSLLKSHNEPRQSTSSIELDYKQRENGKFRPVYYKLSVENKDREDSYTYNLLFYLLRFGRKYNIDLVYHDSPHLVENGRRKGEIELKNSTNVKPGKKPQGMVISREPELMGYEEDFVLIASELPLPGLHAFSQEKIGNWKSVVAENEELSIFREDGGDEIEMQTWIRKRINVKLRRKFWQE